MYIYVYNVDICFATFQELFFCSYFFSFVYETYQQSFVSMSRLIF